MGVLQKAGRSHCNRSGDIADQCIKILMDPERKPSVYKLFKNFALGAGIDRIGVNAEVDDDDWRGQVTDSYRGFNVFGTFYF